MDKLIAMSRAFGCDPDMVQAGGGNTSMKENDILIVKSSGKALRDISSASDFVSLNLDGLMSIVSDGSLSLLNDLELDLQIKYRVGCTMLSKGMPSIESLMHSLTDWIYTAHLHPVYANALACSENGTRMAQSLFNQDEYIFVKYKCPGYRIARAIYEEFQYRGRPYPPIVFMENHGIILSADDPDGVIWLASTLSERLKELFGDLNPPKITSETLKRQSMHGYVAATLSKAYPMGSWSWSLSPHSNEIATNDLLLRETLRGALYPDHIVYLGQSPLILSPGTSNADITEAYHSYKTLHNAEPCYAIVPSVGVLLFGKSFKQTKQREEMLDTHAKVLRLILRTGRPLCLGNDETSWINNWEAEKYRQSMQENAMSSGGQGI